MLSKGPLGSRAHGPMGPLGPGPGPGPRGPHNPGMVINPIRAAPGARGPGPGPRGPWAHGPLSPRGPRAWALLDNCLDNMV